MRPPVVAVHGGAGDVPAELREAHAQGVARAAEAGLAVLMRGGSALDAVEHTVALLEDDPRYNAGTGACLNEHGELELDAAIMAGDGLRAGAVAALSPFRNPIRIARAVLEDARHVLYAAHGAYSFALQHGFEPASIESMRTPSAVERLRLVLAGRAEPGWAGGTVGAVAYDAEGHVAAATSTGGMVGKARGRVGDTPILGAGTYADARAGACSATGLGERILRATLARKACELLERGASAQDAASEAMRFFGERVGGGGGMVLVDRDGGAGYAFDTSTMSWAIARAGEVTASGH